MKKILTIILIAILISAGIFSIGLIVYLLGSTISGSVGVFDFANFLCTILFSLIAIGISLWELIKNRKSDKRKESVKQHLSELIEKKKSEIEAIDQKRATDIIPDFPTYSDLPLERMCELYDEFHSKYSKTATKAIEEYIKSARSALALVINKGEHLPMSMIAMTISMIESIDRLEADLVHFKEICDVNTWKIYVAKCTNIEENEKDKMRQKIYEEGNEMCVASNELYAKVLLSLEWFEVLCDSVKA